MFSQDSGHETPDSRANQRGEESSTSGAFRTDFGGQSAATVKKNKKKKFQD